MAKKKSILPDGVTDCEMNKSQLASAFGKSTVTIDDWISKGMPVKDRGTNGSAYTFQLSDCFRWYEDRKAVDRQRTEAAESAARQMRLALVGDDGAEGDDQFAELTPRERREIYETERQWMAAARDRGDLIRRDDAYDQLVALFEIIRDGLTALPDRLAREAALDGSQIERAIASCDEMIDELRTSIEAGPAGLDDGAAMLEAAE